MNFYFIYILVLLFSLIASVFVIITNIKDANKSISKLDFRILSIQLVILLTWIIVLSKALRADNLDEAIINGAVFVFSLVIGVLIIQSVIKENKASDLINKLIENLSVYNRKLIKLDKQKTDFVSQASHQLRSPNSVVLGYSSMLLENDFGKLTKKQKDVIKTIFDASANLNNVINELLDTARIEQDRMQYKIKDFDLIDVLEEVCNFYKDLAKRKDLEFIQDFDTNYSIQIRGDREKIKQVLMNIIDNALKYTEKGSIQIKACKKNDKVSICVSDTGIGIKKDEINEIFNKFSRAGNAENMNVSGNGLGLFIAKEIVLANKGKIWVESDGEGRGSKFFVEFATIS